MSGTLGCGDYRAFVHTRASLSRAVLEVPWTRLQWGRVIDDTSAAQVVAGAGCCGELNGASIDTWSHQLSVVRIGDGRVWSGPIINLRDTAEEGVVIDARDLSSWRDHRLVHDDHFHIGEALTSIYEAIHADAMAPDPIEDYTLVVTPGTATGDREILAESHTIAGEPLRELGRTGIDWTVVDRVEYVAGEELDPVVLPDGGAPDGGALIDEHFVTPPDVELDGTGRANRWIVSGSGGGAEGDEVVGEATAAPGPEGLLESVASEADILDDLSAGDAADARLARSRTPQRFVREAVLGPNAPVSIHDLVPGRRVRLALPGRCLSVYGVQRLTSVGVVVQRTQGGITEAVTLSFEPLGAVAS